jgi:(2Fe-2S) ferredoxin
MSDRQIRRPSGFSSSEAPTCTYKRANQRKVAGLAVYHLPRPVTFFYMAKFEKHIFICGNQRPAGHPRGCCDPAGKAELQKLFKQKLAERKLKGTVRANQSGCLDQCEHGPNIVIYPDAVWYGGVTLADVDEIVECHIVGGKPVERLRMKDSCINTPSCEHRPPIARDSSLRSE